VKGDGRWKVYGSWGSFYDIVKPRCRAALRRRPLAEYYYTLTRRLGSRAGLVRPPARPADPGTGRLPPPSFDLLEPDPKPYQLQDLFGIEHEPTPKMSPALRYVHKQVDTAIEDIGSLTPKATRST
jgi:hypothetical protein